MRALAPQMAQLRKQYGDDRRKLAEETQKMQREHGVDPLGALVPALIQVPVFLALLHVLRYFNRPGLTFEQNAAIPNYVFGPDQVRSFLEARLFGAPLSAYVRMPRSCSTRSAITSTGSTSSRSQGRSWCSRPSR